MAKVDHSEVYKAFTWFTTQAGFPSTELRDIIHHFKIDKNEEGLYPVSTILYSINEQKKTVSRRRGLNLSQLEEIKKQEEIIKLQLYNGEKNGILIKRSYAKERVRIVFQSVVSKIRYAIKNISPRLVGMDNARLVEEIITKAWNGAITLLEQEAKCIDWENDNTKENISDTKPVTFYASTGREVDESLTAVTQPRESEAMIDR